MGWKGGVGWNAECRRDLLRISPGALVTAVTSQTSLHVAKKGTLEGTKHTFHD